MYAKDNKLHMKCYVYIANVRIFARFVLRFTGVHVVVHENIYWLPQQILALHMQKAS